MSSRIYPDSRERSRPRVVLAKLFLVIADFTISYQIIELKFLGWHAENLLVPVFFVRAISASLFSVSLTNGLA